MRKILRRKLDSRGQYACQTGSIYIYVEFPYLYPNYNIYVQIAIYIYPNCNICIQMVIYNLCPKCQQIIFKQFDGYMSRNFSTYIYVWIYENRHFFLFQLHVFLISLFIFAFATTAACNSYVGNLIKSNEGASLTICQQASSIIVWEACLGCVCGSTLSSVMEGRLPCGDNVVLALDGKDLQPHQFRAYTCNGLDISSCCWHYLL